MSFCWRFLLFSRAYLVGLAEFVLFCLVSTSVGQCDTKLKIASRDQPTSPSFELATRITDQMIVLGEDNRPIRYTLKSRPLVIMCAFPFGSYIETTRLSS